MECPECVNQSDEIIKIKEYLTEYGKVYKKLTKLNKKSKELREQISNILYDLKLDKIIIKDNTDFEWSCCFLSGSRKKIDYQLLEEAINPNLYNKIVLNSDYTMFKISKAPVKKKKIEIPTAILKDQNHIVPENFIIS